MTNDSADTTGRITPEQQRTKELADADEASTTRRGALQSFVVAAAGITGIGAAATPASAAGMTYYIDCVGTGGRLHADPDSSGVDQGSTSWTGSNVQWELTDAGNGNYYIDNVGTGTRLHADSDSSAVDQSSTSWAGGNVQWDLIQT